MGFALANVLFSQAQELFTSIMDYLLFVIVVKIIA